MKIPSETLRKMIELKKQGLTIRAIQKEVGLSSPGLVTHYLKRYGNGEVVEQFNHRFKNSIERYKKEIDFLEKRLLRMKNLLWEEEQEYKYYQSLKK